MKPESSNTHLIQDTVTTPSVSLGRTQRMLYEYKELLGLGGISGTLPIYNHCQTLKPSVKLVLEKAGANPLPQSRDPKMSHTGRNTASISNVILC